MRIQKYILLVLLICITIGSERVDLNNSTSHPWSQFSNVGGNLGKLGEFTYPTNPMNDRAIGYLFKGKAKSAVTNYGEFIEWDVHPAGLWGDYTYLPDVCFIAGIPGMSYTYKYDWFNSESASNAGLCPAYSSFGDVVLWCSENAYEDPSGIEPGFAWYETGDTNFVGVIFESYLDVNGTLGEEIECDDLSVDDCAQLVTESNQWFLNDDSELLVISLPADGNYIVNPNNSNVYGDPSTKKTAGLIYPWALRPALKQRLSEFDLYEFGEDNEEWTVDDSYAYYGSNVAESWFTRWNPSSNTDWQPSTGARLNTHNTKVSAGDVFGNEVYVNETNTYPLLAHSEVVDTWPEGFTEDGSLAPIWPGGYAESFSPEETSCFPAKRWNDDCWISVTGRFVSNQDIYMEFNDKWAHRGSQVDDNKYESTGYPMGLNVMATGHSYSVAFAEDIMFVTVDVRNESGDNWCAYEKNRYGDRVYVTDSNGALICGDAMIMPDGTKLNRGKGFTYRDVAMGFYMDADVVSTDIYGNFGVHTNADDFMEYYDCANPLLEPEGCQVINDDTLRVSIAMIYDYNNISGVATDIGIVGTQLLDSPYATEPVDLDGDGIPDIYPGSKLKMTDWHWFDWYNRPGVVYREGEAGCCAGDVNTAQAINKEDIQYKLMIGDTTNLSDDEKSWFFHTDDPSVDDHENNLNPHFDSLEGLALTEFFQDDPDGLDCVLEMTCGPFSLEIGEQVPFSFCIIFGQNKTDLIDNARFAQLMYNSHYQGYTEPDYPTLTGVHDKGMIKLSWDDIAEKSTDVVTGYADFEGYKIYKSIDGGGTWGGSTDKIYNSDGTHVGWKPYAQFHLNSEQDSTRCVFLAGNDGAIESIDYTYDEIYEVDPNTNEIIDTITTIVESDTTFFECGSVRGMNVCGNDVHTPWFSLGACDDFEEIFYGYSQNQCSSHRLGTWSNSLSLCYYDINANEKWDEHIGIVHDFIDYDVIDGIDYTYSVTAYDMGIAPDFSLGYNENLGILDTTYSTANPLHFATPSGYQFIETGKGTSVNDKNFITIKPGPKASEVLMDEIKVVPNPYLVSSAYNETEYSRKLRFTNLPENCKVTIYTISGERVVSFSKPGNNDHADCGNEVSGSCYWNMRTINNQEIAPGLYVFSVEDLSDNKGRKFIGKFAVVK